MTQASPCPYVGIFWCAPNARGVLVTDPAIGKVADAAKFINSSAHHVCRLITLAFSDGGEVRARPGKVGANVPSSNNACSHASACA
ncbi:hypothetical protein DHODJN_13855 [Methylorubrum extorquens]